MPGATQQLGQSPRRKVVSAAKGAALTPFDPIKDVPTIRRTVVINAGDTRAMGGLPKQFRSVNINARSNIRARTEGERGVALPRRNYRRTVL